MAKRIKRKEPLPEVKYIPTQYNPELGWSGAKPALCFSDGRCVLIGDEEISTVRRPPDVIEQSRYCGWLGPPPQRYPPNRFVAFCYNSEKPLSPEARMLLKKTMKHFPDWVEPEKTTPSREPRKSVSGPTNSKVDLKALAAEHNMDPPKLRRTLRKAGLRAPYDDEEEIRRVLKSNKRKSK